MSADPECRTGEQGPQPLVQFHTRLRSRSAEAFLAVRALALSLGPDVVEKVTPSNVCYLRRDKAFLTVQGAKTKVLLLFPREVPLQDPMGRLLKRGDERYLPLDSPDHLDGHVQEFIRRSYTASKA